MKYKQLEFTGCLSWNLDRYICYCNWVDTRRQQYSTHLHTNNTQNNTINLGIVRAVPHLCEFYFGICLTIEEKARKTSVRVECVFSKWSFISLFKHFEEHSPFVWNGHLISPYKQPTWCLGMCAMGNQSGQPLFLLAQGYFCLVTMFSRATFLISERPTYPLHLGQRSSLVHLLQKLWPLLHRRMGGTMNFSHSGHFNSVNRTSSRARNKSSISKT